MRILHNVVILWISMSFPFFHIHLKQSFDDIIKLISSLTPPFHCCNYSRTATDNIINQHYMTCIHMSSNIIHGVFHFVNANFNCVCSNLPEMNVRFLCFNPSDSFYLLHPTVRILGLQFHTTRLTVFNWHNDCRIFSVTKHLNANSFLGNPSWICYFCGNTCVRVT